MITQAESGLSEVNYNFIKSLRTDYCFKVIASRYNLDFGDTVQFAGAASTPGVDFDVLALSTYLFRVYGTTGLERMDTTTQIWTVLSISAPSNPCPNCRISLASNGTTLYAFAATAGAIQRNSSTDYGGTWSGWSNIYTYTNAQFYTGNLFKSGYNGSVSASATQTTFAASRAMDGGTGALNYWRTPTGTLSAQLIWHFNPADATNIEKYMVMSNAKTWTFQGSANGSSWTTLHTVTNDTGGLTAREYTFSNATSYEYYRWNVTAINGAANCIIFYEAMAMAKTTDQEINFLKAVTWDSVHFVKSSSSSYWDEIGHIYWNGATYSNAIGPMLSVKPRSFDAVRIDVNGVTYECALVDTETPGRPLETLSGSTLIVQTEAEGGIMAFMMNPLSHTYSDHIWVDKIAPMDIYNYRSNIKASVINGKVFLTCIHSTGDVFNTIKTYRYYTTKDLVNWSAPRQLVIPSGIDSGVHLINAGQYIFALERKNVWRSYSTLLTGLAADAVQEDITSRIHEYTTSQSGSYQASMVFKNDDDHFTDHAFINEENLVAFEHFLGGWNGPSQMLYRTAVTQMDDFKSSDKPGQYMVSCSARDHFAWMTDDTQAEQAIIKDGFNVGLDSFSDQSGTNYGGLAHFATVSGEWQTINNELIATPGENASRICVGYSSFNPDVWNGVAQVALKLNSSGTIQGGIVFRLKNDNYHAIYYDKGSDTLFMERFGFDTSSGTLSSAASIGWSGTIASQYKYLRVRMFYNSLRAYTSSDGITWTEKITYFFTNPYKERPSIPRPKSLGLGAGIEKGYVGLYCNIAPTAGAQGFFSNFQIMDMEQPLTVEGAFKSFGSFAGIHDFQMGELYTRGSAGWILGSGTTLTDPLAADARYDQSLYDGGDVYSA